MNDEPGGAALSRESILDLLEAPDPLIAGYLDLGAQAQPNGFDVTVGEVIEFTSAGEITENDRSLSSTHPLQWNASGNLDLEPGSYLAVLNERISLPLSIMALMQPRSSLLRSGVTLHTAVWDAGYRGRSQVMLTVLNPTASAWVVMPESASSSSSNWTGRSSRDTGGSTKTKTSHPRRRAAPQ